MIVLGLTGSIATGKSTLAAQCRLLGARVCDSDAIVHRLLARGGAAVKPLSELFPEVIENDAVNRAELAKTVFNKPEQLRALETIVHPLVRAAQTRFLTCAVRDGTQIAVLDIPLLYETGAEIRCDYVIVATAPHFLQTQRALRRPRMTAEKLASIRARQLPDSEKRKRADWVVQTGLGKRHSLNALRHIFRVIRVK